MATVALRIVRDDASQLVATHTIADADVTRVITALSAQLGKTPQQIVQYALDRVCNQAVALTRRIEQEAVPVAPIPLS